jgi:hypothetical protein
MIHLHDDDGGSGVRVKIYGGKIKGWLHNIST